LESIVMKILFVVALLAFATGAGAQTSPAKKELVAKILQLQQPAVERVARGMAERPAAMLMQRVGEIMQTRTPPDKRQALATEIQADIKKYVDEAVPIVRDRAVKLAPSTIGTLLDERFTEDELKQLVAIIESPVNRKFQQLDSELTKSLQEKLFAETRVLMEPKIKAMEVAVAGRLGIPLTPPTPAASGAARTAPAKATTN
jgi:hypothetical protein